MCFRDFLLYDNGSHIRHTKRFFVKVTEPVRFQAHISVLQQSMWSGENTSNFETKTQQPIQIKSDARPLPTEQQQQEGEQLEERQSEEGDEQIEIKGDQQEENKSDPQLSFKITERQPCEQPEDQEVCNSSAIPTVEELRDLAREGEEALCSEQLIAHLRSCCRRLRAEQQLRPMVLDQAVPSRAIAE